MIETKRLILREWQQEDLLPFFHMNNDPEVMKYFPSALIQQKSDEYAEEIQRRISINDWGFWAVELKGDRSFIGFVGLNQPGIDLPFTPCVEVGWRLTRNAWGKGYASEAAKKSLEFAFGELGLHEVVSFTPVINSRSQAVMKRIGMKNTGENFLHPSVQRESPLAEHVLYKISREEFKI